LRDSKQVWIRDEPDSQVDGEAEKGAFPMSLAELIQKALGNPQYRIALETGTLQLESIGLGVEDIAAVAEVMRYSRLHEAANGRELFESLFGPTVFTIGWRQSPEA
jgi:hypothetical protein